MFFHCGGACMYKKSKSQQTRTTKKSCARISYSFNTQKLPSCVIKVFAIDTNMYKGISKHFWKKIVQLLWTVVTYQLFTDFEYGIEHDIAYRVCIGTLDINF